MKNIIFIYFDKNKILRFFTNKIMKNNINIAMPNNLWEIIKFDDLVYLLRNAEKRFVVLSIITEDTDDKIKKLMKSFIKDKSKVYPKVTFLFYRAKKEDFGRLSPMFDKDETYPKMFNIWDIKKIYSGVLCVDNREILESTMDDLHESYIAGHPIEEFDNNSEEKNDINSDQKKIITKNEQIINQQKYNNVNNNVNNNIIPLGQPPKDPVIEKKKFIEKINLLRKKQEESIDDFLRELEKRKEEEESKDDNKNKEKKERKKNKS
jgi:hypothetical protein